MPRGRKFIRKIEIMPDRKYHDIRLAKFINYVMKKGKKNAALVIVYGALEFLAKQTNQDPISVFEKAIDNAAPIMEVRSTRVGGATYQVPYEVTTARKFTLASRWIIGSACQKHGKPMQELLADELLAAYNNEGAAVKKKLDTHKMAEANKAFAHYARF